MDETNFWSALEYRVCRELTGVDECAKVRMWCDGFLPHTVDLGGRPRRIRGRAWIGFGSDQEPWTFELLLPVAVANPAEIRWVDLLPAESTTRWLSVDPVRKHLVMAPGEAV